MSLHTYCSSCIKAVEKMWPIQNGCLLCNTHANETSEMPKSASNEAEDQNRHNSVDATMKNESPSSRIACPNHPSEIAFCYCVTCSRAACGTCVGDACATHDHIFFGEGSSLMSRGESDVHSSMLLMLQRAKLRAKDLEPSVRRAEDLTVELRMQISKARIDVDASYTFFCDLLRERRAQIVGELESLYSSRWQTLNTELQDVRTHIDSILEFANIVETVVLSSKENAVSDVMFAPIAGKLQAMLDGLLHYEPKSLDNSPTADIEFVSNRHAMQATAQNCLGYLHSGGGADGVLKITTSVASSIPQQAIPIGPQPAVGFESSTTPVTMFTSSVPRLNVSSIVPSSSSVPPPSSCWSNSFGLYFGSDVDPTSKMLPSATFQGTVGAEKQSAELTIGTNGVWPVPAVTGANNGFEPNENILEGLSQSVVPIVSLPSIKRQKMGYHCKFGEFGSRPGQFVEPSGIATNAVNDIIIADTNNHRLEVFDGSGMFKYEIVGGQTDCDLVYPNRLAVCRSTGDIVVTERSPTHQVQIFDRCGNFLRRFGGRVLQHPRGVAVDTHGRIVVVECRVMRVVIFDASGTVVNRFSLMGELEFPNGVAVDDNEHIFISDNRAHCVKVCQILSFR